jgi:hypothetical protein
VSRLANILAHLCTVTVGKTRLYILTWCEVKGVSQVKYEDAMNRESYHIEVSGRKINELVRLGQYDWNDPNINDQNFETDESHHTEIILVHLSKVMSTDAVLKALDEENLRQATMSQLLTLGIKYPYLQEQFPIIALGATWSNKDGHCFVGGLGFHKGLRRLFLDYIGDDDWLDTCRFAAVRKQYIRRAS